MECDCGPWHVAHELLLPVANGTEYGTLYSAHAVAAPCVAHVVRIVLLITIDVDVWLVHHVDEQPHTSESQVHLVGIRQK